jgi:phage tail sheath protein FI
MERRTGRWGHVSPVEPGTYIVEVGATPPPIQGVATSTAAFVGSAVSGPYDESVRITSLTEYERTFGGLSVETPLGYAVRDFFANGGADAVVVRVESDVAGPGLADARRGIYALDDVDLFNLLCLPLLDGSADPEAVGEVATYCERRRAMLLLDPPSTWDSATAAREGVSVLGTASPNAAVYFPRLRQPDASGAGQVVDLAPSGAVAGVIARTDSERGFWKAPAGLSAYLRGVPELSERLTDSDTGVLNPLGVNCLRDMPGSGPVVWGARTLQGDDRFASEWKYVPVRRTALFLEESVDRGTRWTVFEPNDEPTWARVRLQVGDFLSSLWRQGAFQGQSPDEGYFVHCGANTMTQNDLDNGRLVIEIGFAPLKPAEFVVFRITHHSAVQEH